MGNNKIDKRELIKINRRRGIRNEKAIAKRLNGKRVGLLGKEDVSNPILSIEAKSVRAFRGEKWMIQAHRNAPKDPTGKLLRIPVVVVHLPNQKRSKDILMIRLSDWEDLFGKIQIKQGG